MNKQAAVGLVINENNVLIVKKIELDGHYLSGQWHMPGGKLEEGETYEQALKREVMEETNIDVDIIEPIDEYTNDATGWTARWFLCRYVSGDIRPGDDIQKARFVPKGSVFQLCSEKAISLFPDKVSRILHKKQ